MSCKNHLTNLKNPPDDGKKKIYLSNFITFSPSKACLALSLKSWAEISERFFKKIVKCFQINRLLLCISSTY
jgi:hypothetical protein